MTNHTTNNTAHGARRTAHGARRTAHGARHTHTHTHTHHVALTTPNVLGRERKRASSLTYACVGGGIMAEIIWLMGAPGSGKGTNTPFILEARYLFTRARARAYAQGRAQSFRSASRWPVAITVATASAG